MRESSNTTESNVVERLEPEILVAKIQAGDGGAEERLVQQYGRAVYFILNARVGDRDLVDDVYQETFRVVIEKIRRGEILEPAKLSSFIGGVARFTARHFVRKDKRYLADDSLDRLPNPVANHDPLYKLISRENADLVVATLRKLPAPRDREVLMRFYLSDHDKDDICRDLGLSPSQFNRVLHRARNRYKDHLLRTMKRLRIRSNLYF